MNLSQFLYLTTIGWKSRIEHKIEIWFVEYKDKYYIISELKKKADWVRIIMHNPRVSHTINNTIFKGIALIVEQDKEPELTAEVSKLMSTKYGLIVELVYD